MTTSGALSFHVAAQINNPGFASGCGHFDFGDTCGWTLILSARLQLFSRPASSMKGWHIGSILASWTDSEPCRFLQVLFRKAAHFSGTSYVAVRHVEFFGVISGVKLNA
jgi:hypothetical protein